MKNKKIIIGVVVCLVVALLSFRGGRMYASKNITNANASRQGQFTQGGFNQNGGTRGSMMRGGGGFVSGEVLSIDSKSMTVKLPSGGPASTQGGSKIVFFSPTTKVEKTVDGTTADVVVGKQVMITGTANTDGSVNATSVQLRPISATAIQNIPVRQ